MLYSQQRKIILLFHTAQKKYSVLCNIYLRKGSSFQLFNASCSSTFKVKPTSLSFNNDEEEKK